VVGHSFGGPVAVTFTSLFPDEVQGLLLLDASPVGWNTAICGVADGGSPTAAGWRQACALQADPAANPERLDGPVAFAEVATIDSLGDVPMIVATAPTREETAGLPASEAAALNAAWNTGQDHWVSLSSSARLVTVADTGHYIQDDQPEVVLDLIAELL
jgi:pimeloyl-ACP methyl ester carboxylesterase